MTYGTLDDEKGKAAKPRGRRFIVTVAAVAALAALVFTAARAASPQGEFIKLPHKPPKVPTPPTPPTPPLACGPLPPMAQVLAAWRWLAGPRGALTPQAQRADLGEAWSVPVWSVRSRV